MPFKKTTARNDNLKQPAKSTAARVPQWQDAEKNSNFRL